jgi:hypothetical protein
MIEERLRDTFAAVDVAVPDGFVDAAVRDGYRRRNKRRWYAAVAVAAVAVAAVATTALVADHRSGHVNPVVQVKPSATTVPTVTTLPVTTTTILSALTSRLFPVGHVLAAVPDGNSVDIITQPDPASGASIVERIDVRTGAVTVRGPSFDDARTMVRTRNWIWINSSPLAPTGGHHAALVQLDPRTLSVHRAVGLPEEWANLTAADDLLWAGTTDRLYRIDPTHGTILRTVTIEAQDPGAAAGVALDPDGHWLWVSETNVGLDLNHPNRPYSPLVISRRDPTTGALQLQRRNLPSVVGGSLYPMHNALWVATPTGMLAALIRLTPNLTQDAQWNRTGEPIGPNGATVALVGNRLWVANPAALTLQCGDPTTGAVLATRHLNSQQLGVPTADVDDRLLIATDQGLTITSMQAECP